VRKWTQPLVTDERIRTVAASLVRQQNEAAEREKLTADNAM
jgi:hypothetical protein